MYIIGFAFPFFLAFSTENMWLREVWYTEQPIIGIRNEAIVYALQDGTTQSYSTVSRLNSQFTNKLNGASISSFDYDDDNDGKADRIISTVSFQGNPSTLQGISLYLFFDVGLRDRVQIQMQDFVRFDLSSGIGLQKANIYGSLKLNQKSALRPSSTIRETNNVNFFTNALQNVNTVSLATIKANRNTTITSEMITSVTPSGSTNGLITINLELYVPKEQRILYVPTLLENLKLSWILYLGYLIPILYIVDKVLKFAYRNRLVPTQVVNDLPRRKKID